MKDETDDKPISLLFKIVHVLGSKTSHSTHSKNFSIIRYNNV